MVVINCTFVLILVTISNFVASHKDQYRLVIDSALNYAGRSNQGDRPGRASDTHSCNYIRAVPEHLRSPEHMYPQGLGQFYQKYTEVYGIPVLGSQYLPDEALQRACYVARFVLADNYHFRHHYYRYYGRFAIMTETEVTTDIPEHADLGEEWNDRARGLGATRSRPVSTGAEENALCYSHDRYRVEDIVIHEFSHGAHILGARYATPGFDKQLYETYTSAMASGLWQNTYAATNAVEYFAEGVQSFFNVNGYANPPDGIHNHVDTRDKLRTYDPTLYNFVSGFFSCNNTYLYRCDLDRDGELNQALRLNCSSSDAWENCTDSNEGCPDWAVSGQCTSNPGYMDANCKRSCGKCDGGGTQPGDCVDNNTSCPDWAAQGECDANPDYMHQNCRKSCDLCENTECVDNNPYCPGWAEQGECIINPDYMLENCMKSCNICQKYNWHQGVKARRRRAQS